MRVLVEWPIEEERRRNLIEEFCDGGRFQTSKAKGGKRKRKRNVDTVEA